MRRDITDLYLRSRRWPDGGASRDKSELHHDGHIKRRWPGRSRWYVGGSGASDSDTEKFGNPSRPLAAPAPAGRVPRVHAKNVLLTSRFRRAASRPPQEDATHRASSRREVVYGAAISGRLRRLVANQKVSQAPFTHQLPGYGFCLLSMSRGVRLSATPRGWLVAWLGLTAAIRALMPGITCMRGSFAMQPKPDLAPSRCGEAGVTGRDAVRPLFCSLFAFFVLGGLTVPPSCALRPLLALCLKARPPSTPARVHNATTAFQQYSPTATRFPRLATTPMAIL